MDIERAERRKVDDVTRQNVAVRDDDRDVGLQRTHGRRELGAARLLGLQHGDLLTFGTLLHRGCGQLRARTPYGAVGLRDHSNYLEPFAQERPEVTTAAQKLKDEVLASGGDAMSSGASVPPVAMSTITAR